MALGNKSAATADMSHMTTDDNRIDARDWSLLGLLSVLWGGSFFFNSLVLR